MSSSSIPATDTTDAAAVTLPGLGDVSVRADGVDEARKACMERAGRLLAARARSERELTDRLGAAGFEVELVTATIGRLRELRLVDDADFARRWVEERSGRRGLGPGKLRAELVAKGVAPEVIDGALAEVGTDEDARARELAGTLVRKVARKPLHAQASSLWQMLRRKGYSAEACEAAVKAVLPPEGWD